MLPRHHKVNINWFLGDIMGKEMPNLYDPFIYSTTAVCLYTVYDCTVW